MDDERQIRFGFPRHPVLAPSLYEIDPEKKAAADALTATRKGLCCARLDLLRDKRLRRQDRGSHAPATEILDEATGRALVPHAAERRSLSVCNLCAGRAGEDASGKSNA